MTFNQALAITVSATADERRTWADHHYATSQELYSSENTKLANKEFRQALKWTFSEIGYRKFAQELYPV